MRARNAKVPHATVLQQLVAEGLTLRQIATRYGAHAETVRQSLRRSGFIIQARRAPPVDGPRDRAPVHAPPGIQLLDDRTVCARRVTANGTSGSTYFKISLPRVSLHIDQLRETNRC